MRTASALICAPEPRNQTSAATDNLLGPSLRAFRTEPFLEGPHGFRPDLPNLHLANDITDFLSAYAAALYFGSGFAGGVCVTGSDRDAPARRR